MERDRVEGCGTNNVPKNGRTIEHRGTSDPGKVYTRGNMKVEDDVTDHLSSTRKPLSSLPSSLPYFPSLIQGTPSDSIRGQ